MHIPSQGQQPPRSNHLHVLLPYGRGGFTQIKGGLHRHHEHIVAAGLALGNQGLEHLIRILAQYPSHLQTAFCHIGLKGEHREINSSGLKEIVEGTPIAKEFRYIFAGSFIYDENGEAVWPGIAVDSTNKTQFLFKINKGIFSARDNKRLNSSMAEEKKRVPFTNMIYFGDGETDVPCMKIVSMFGGNSVAVYAPGNEKKRAIAQRLKKQGRVRFTVPAQYTADSTAYRLVCAIIDKIKADTVLQQFSK